MHKRMIRFIGKERTKTFSRILSITYNIEEGTYHFHVLDRKGSLLGDIVLAREKILDPLRLLSSTLIKG